MMTLDQLKNAARLFSINEATVLREYLQIAFLNTLYGYSQSEKIFFKGGTAIHLLFKAPRFSEDLNFTVELKAEDFNLFIKKVFNAFSSIESVSFKEKKNITGKSYLLTAAPSIFPYHAYVSLDFSFREKVFDPQKSILSTDFPLIVSNLITHLSKEEIFAEKIRAIMTRKKGRDLYDLWYLLNLGVSSNNKLIKEKLKYYHLQNASKETILEKVSDFKEKDFILDVRPFIPTKERSKLPSLFVYIKKYLTEKL